MHLPQIAASLKVVEDLAEPDRAARPAPTGGGFQEVFSGNATSESAAPSGVDGQGGQGPDVPQVTQNAAQSVFSREDAAGAEEFAVDTAGGGLRAGVGVLTGEEDATADGQASEQDASTVPGDDFGETAIPDGWFLPGFATSSKMEAPVDVPGAANAAPSLQGLSQGITTGRAVPEPINVAVSATPGANAGQIVGPNDAATTGHAFSVPGAGEDKPTQTATAAGGNILRTGPLTTAPQPAMTIPDTGGQNPVADLMRTLGAPGLDAKGLPGGLPGGSQTRPADTISATQATRIEGGGAMQPAVSPPVAPANVAPANVAQANPAPANGVPSPAEPRALASDAPEAGTEHRLAPAPVSATAAPSAAGKTETTTLVSAATAVAPTVSGADTVAAVRGDGAAGAGAGDSLFDADPLMTDPTLGETRAMARGPAAGPLSVLHAPETPRQVALQIAEVVRASGQRAVELKLQPEELGRVHLTMSQDATGQLTVSLNVERADTLDLLRRNIEMLRADLHELGYESVDFSFQENGAGGGQDAQAGRGDGAGALEIGDAHATGPTPQAGIGGADASGDGIDIRL